MTKEQVKFYGELFSSLGLTELKISNKDSELVLKKEVNIMTTVTGTNSNENPVITNNNTDNNVSDNNEISTGTAVKAPLVGIFYTKPSPTEETFVKIGDYVNKGDVLCIIEAMKMFNEIKADISGRVVDICANNGNVVEYGETIFVIEKD